KSRVDDESTQGLIARARSWIFERGYHLTSKMVECILKLLSLLPTRSTFSECLALSGFNFYLMFVPDIMHEFELGNFKAFFAMILRILFAFDVDNLTRLNSHFRRVSTFGRYAIRKFVSNVSSLTNFTAHDYENVLKLAMPVVEGLLPEPLNTIVLDLLWACAVWHALAKLRVHTESTLNVLEVSTTSLGIAARRFAKECKRHNIQELPTEEAALNNTGKKSGNSKGKEKDTGPKQKQLNLQTFKWHNICHYVEAIRRFGPTDGYSTQIGELEHQRVKRFYARTSRKTYAQQIGQHVRCEKILHSITQREAARRERIASGASSEARKQGR
ncbi:hypothetical protein BDY19DRAFT_872519, partial [Irpex rosettiformis]